MQVQTILNRVQQHKSFVYRRAASRGNDAGLAWTTRRTRAQRPAGLLRLRDEGGPAMTACRHAASSSCPCGASPSSSSTLCGGWIAPAAASG